MPARGHRVYLDAVQHDYTDEQVIEAVESLADSDSVREAERVIGLAAPQIQRILGEALAAGGWFDESHESEVLRVATVPDQDERLTAVRTLLAEEARIATMIGAAIGWSLAQELDKTDTEGGEQE